jgi:hypothetical protein
MDARKIVQQQEALEADRTLFEQMWQDCALFCLPKNNMFFKRNVTQGEDKDNQRYDDTALLAVSKASSIISSLLTPASTNWHQFEVDGQESDDEGARWLEKLSDFLYKKRYRTAASFSSQSYELYQSLLTFGTGVFIVEDKVGSGVYYKAAHIGEFFFTENYFGKVDKVFRKYPLTASQAVDQFGQDALDTRMRNALEKGSLEKFYFIHAVLPDADGAFDSYHVNHDAKTIIKSGKMKRNPYIITRYSTGIGEVYGRSPAMNCLNEIKMLNSMRRTDYRIRNKAADTTLIAADAKTVRGTLQVGRINYGMLSDQGAPLVRPLDMGGRPDISSDSIRESREIINEAFLLNLFQILVDQPSMTATEVLQRAQEKGQLISPLMMRQESDFLNPTIENELSYYEDYGIFQDDGVLAMPQSIKDAGGLFSIKYTSPMANLARAEEALSTEKLLQSMLPLAQFDPNIVGRFDFKEYGDVMRRSYGAPAKIFKTDDVLAAELEQKRQQEELAMLAQAAPSIAGSIKDIAQAESYAAVQ